DVGIDTVEANHVLGFKADCRDFSLAAAILRDLGVRRVRLLTNNPRKMRGLSHAGIEIVARFPCEVAATPHSFHYLRTKKEKMGHALSFPPNVGIRERESACIGETALDLQQRSGPFDEILTLLCGEHGCAIDAGSRVRGIEAQL